jgi:thioredoxin reductase
MRRYEMICVGAGPAGLAAAVEAARHGVQVIAFDENERPGGQLFKQIHKFFGSREHRAMERGFNIGNSFLDEAKELGVEVSLNSVILGIYENGAMNVMVADRIEQVKAQKTLVATGASENMIPFPGWTLPGVIGAGAAQTMTNIHGIRPGNDILMVGSGNVGVIVSYQMMQAGSRVAAVIDAASKIGGYAVHGKDRVEGATVIQVDDSWKPIEGTEKRFDVDTICIAVGLNPMSQLLRMAGCKLTYVPTLGGRIPAHDVNQETSIKGIYVAGDVSGIEEASTAIIEGRIAGLAIAHSLGYLNEASFLDQRDQQYLSMKGLRSGSHGERRGKAKEYLNAMMKG